MSLKNTYICPLCGSTIYTLFSPENIKEEKLNSYSYASRKEPEYMSYELVRCISCSLVYANPPKNLDLHNAYSNAAYDSNEEACFAAQSYIRALKPYLQELHSRNFAVEVGAGNGAFLQHLLDNGFQEVLGIEPSKEAIAAATQDIKPYLQQASFSSDLLNGRQVSLLCSFMTLEHIEHHKTFIEEAFNALEPGGMLAVVTHNYQAFINKILNKKSPILDIEHLQLFCPEALKIVMHKIGFINVRTRSFMNKYPLRYWARLLPLPKSIKKPLLQKMYTENCCTWFNYPVSLPIGNILTVCIKPSVYKVGGV